MPRRTVLEQGFGQPLPGGCSRIRWGHSNCHRRVSLARNERSSRNGRATRRRCDRRRDVNVAPVVWLRQAMQVLRSRPSWKPAVPSDGARGRPPVRYPCGVRWAGSETSGFSAQAVALADAKGESAAVLMYSTDFNEHDARLVVPDRFDTVLTSGEFIVGAVTALDRGGWLVALAPRKSPWAGAPDVPWLKVFKVNKKGKVVWSSESDKLAGDWGGDVAGDVAGLIAEPTGAIEVFVRQACGWWQPQRIAADLASGSLTSLTTARGSRWVAGTVDIANKGEDPFGTGYAEGVSVPLATWAATDEGWCNGKMCEPSRSCTAISSAIYILPPTSN